MIEFMGALYNEAGQVWDLVHHVAPYVDKINFVDDGSVDGTLDVLHGLDNISPWLIKFKTINHTGLPETVKAEALKMVRDGSWVLMLDADERFAPGHIEKVVEFINSPQSEHYTHIWFNLEEAIDGIPTRHFLKCRAFRKDAATFSDGVHIDDSFSGSGYNGGWTVYHFKTSTKQIQREKEYIKTYEKLVAEGKMTPERMKELKGMHYFVR